MAESRGVSARRRGRPQRLPEDPSPLASHAISCNARIAWLLTVSRLLGHEEELARRDGFLSALADHGITVDNSRVSRWESGTQMLPGRIVGGYEAVLGLPRGALVSVVSGLRRAFGPPPTPREALDRDHDLTDGAVDRLLDLTTAGLAHGGHWLALTAQLHRYERVYLRDRDWRLICGQLVKELATAVSIGYVRRYEAAATLVQHPNAYRHLTRALGEFVVNPDIQVVSPVLNLLAEVNSPPANDLVLRLLGDENRDLRRAASSVAATKMARGHFDDSALPQLEPHVVGSLRRGESLDGRLDSFDLAVQLPPESWQRISGALRTRRAHDLVERARRTGELVPSTQSAGLVQELAANVQAETPAHRPLEPDQMLRRLLREALLHSHKARRHHAALLLAASPYAGAVSRHCQALAEHPNDLLAARAWTVLMRVGHAGRRDLVIRKALEEPRGSIRARALVNLGLSAEPLPHHTGIALAERTHAATRPADARANLFVLGMKGVENVKDLCESEDETTRRAALWWIEQGPAIHDSDATAWTEVAFTRSQ